MIDIAVFAYKESIGGVMDTPSSHCQSRPTPPFELSPFGNSKLDQGALL
jgi:hypothetical protein